MMCRLVRWRDVFVLFGICSCLCLLLPVSCIHTTPPRCTASPAHTLKPSARRPSRRIMLLGCYSGRTAMAPAARHPSEQFCCFEHCSRATAGSHITHPINYPCHNASPHTTFTLHIHIPWHQQRHLITDTLTTTFLARLPPGGDGSVPPRAQTGWPVPGCHVWRADAAGA
jgi:hypothetical protein